MKAPKITQSCIKSLYKTKYLNLFDLEYDEGKHYYEATRRTKGNLIATKSGEDYKTLLPDAVTCIVILEIENEEPLLLLSKEFRYPAGQFLLSPPAGLIDSTDADSVCSNNINISDSCHYSENIRNALFSAAIREIYEETGLRIQEKDTLKIVSPFLFSTPGMTDESNGLVLALIKRNDLSELSQSGALGSECFDGFELLNRQKAREVLSSGRDSDGIYYSVYTWAALTYFVAELWKD